jgi:anti-sigma-K factor RskA
MPSLSCEQCEELLPGYVLGALALDEAVAVAEHLATCPQCQASLEIYEAVVDRLGEAVIQLEPPAPIRQRLLATVQAELTPHPAAPGAQRQRWRPARLPRWAMALTALNALIFLVSVWWSWQAWRDLAVAREQLRLTQDQLHTAQDQLRLTQEQLQQVRRQLSLRALLRSDDSPARGALLETTTSQAVLIVQDLPRLQSDRVYQLWLRRGSTRDNGGIFQVDAQGFGIMLVNTPHPLSEYSLAGITEEPTGGSPGPTTPRVIGGAVSP